MSMDATRAGTAIAASLAGLSSTTPEQDTALQASMTAIAQGMIDEVEGYYDGGSAGGVQTVAYAVGVDLTIDFSAGSKLRYTGINGSVKILRTDNPVAGGVLYVVMYNLVGGQTVDWNSEFKFPAYKSATTSATGSVDVYTFLFDGDYWLCTSIVMGNT